MVHKSFLLLCFGLSVPASWSTEIYLKEKCGQSPKWSSAKRVFEKRVVKITVKTLMLIDL